MLNNIRLYCIMSLPPEIIKLLDICIGRKLTFILFFWLGFFVFNGISTFEGYLTPKPSSPFKPLKISKKENQEKEKKKKEKTRE